MLLADIFSIALSIIGFLLSLQGLWMMSRALWPLRVQNASFRVYRNSIASFVLGLVIIGAVLVLAVAAAKLGAPGKLFAFALGSAFVVYANVGVAGLATHIGRRLPSPADTLRPWRATVRGGVALELAYLVPIVGWLGLLPISLILGAGANTLAFFALPETGRVKAEGGRRKAEEEEEARNVEDVAV
jgi:hypothetical protein